jgi:hypothetical protein
VTKWAASLVEALIDAGQSERFLQQILQLDVSIFRYSKVIKTSFSRQQMNFTAAFLES